MSKVSTFRRCITRVTGPRVARATLLGVALLAGLAGANSPAVSGVESVAAIRAAAEDFVRRQVPDTARAVHIHADQLDARLRLARCGAPLTAALVSGAELRARTAIRVSCAIAPVWSVYVPVVLESDVPVLVLRESAARGARLSAQQVVPETRTVSGLAGAYFTDTSALARHTLTRSLPAGTVLTVDALVPDYIVRQGQQVTLVAAASGIEVRAPGKALEDGRAGARVRVQNLASLKVVQGVVDASGTIDVLP
jgi:flagella basal body P-ring formation protein FlgA